MAGEQSTVSKYSGGTEGGGRREEGREVSGGTEESKQSREIGCRREGGGVH